MGDDDGSRTDEDEGGRELRRDVLLLLLLFDMLGVVKDVEQLKPEYGDEDKLVRFLFIAEDILLPIELMFLVLSSVGSSVVLEFNKLSKLWGEETEVQLAFITEFSVFAWETLEKDVLLQFVRIRSLKPFSLSPLFRLSPNAGAFLLFDMAEDGAMLLDVDDNDVVKSVVLLRSYFWYGLL